MVAIETLITEYLAGATAKELADKYGCSRQNISERLRRQGISYGNNKIGHTLLTHVCPTCNKSYTTRYSNQIFCSSKCIRFKDVCVRGHVLAEDTRDPNYHHRCKICTREQYQRRKNL